jgi:hypothetical protein
MADTWYVWSPIVTERDEQGVPRKFAEMGSTVSAGGLKLSDSQFQQLVDSGAVRNYAPPKLPDNFEGSPIDFLRSERARKEGMSEEQALSLTTTGGAMGPSEEEMLMQATPEAKALAAEQAKAAKA